MQPSTRERVKEILDQAAQLAPGQRERFIRDVAGDEHDVVVEALALLPGLADSGFLGSPTVACSGAGLWTAAGSAVTQLAAGGAVGGRIGRYKLLAPIGEGGFGVVFMAEQTEPVSRRVALKIIKAGMDTRQVIARFEAERQALALMDHPNIARVFDAGATEQGRPYFVMELVRGEPITKYCDREQLSIERRLELFGDVCRAVQHAHQKGVIHRDLKPSNVLVTVSDSEPLAKVIDFGIAKATASPLTDKTLFTELNQLVGTPEYMSPEQADASSADVDTRSDVYALGVLLYELLTGTTPFDRARLKSAGLQGLIQIIREEEAPRPSQRLATLLRWSSDVRVAERPVAGGSSSLEIARCRRVEPQALERRLRGELDWIVMRCLEKDRRRRYETATALAADVQRYLEGEPVLAAPPSRLYPARKFLRRHRVAAAITIALVGTATIGGGAALVQWQRAESAREAESRQRARAEAVSEFLKDLLTAADPAQAKGAKLTVREALDAAAQRIDENPLADQPLVEAEIRSTLGSTYLGLGLYAQAETQLRAADEIQTRELGDEHPDTLRTRCKLVWVLSERTEFAAAARLARPTMEALQRLLGPDHPDTLRAGGLLGNSLAFSNEFVEGEALLLSVLERRKRVQGPDHTDTARTMNSLGNIYIQFAQAEKAEPLHREAWRIYKQAFGDEHPETINSMYYVASALDERGRIAEAEELFRSIMEPALRVWGPDHVYVPSIRGDIAACVQKRGRHAEAEAIYREVIVDLERIAGPADLATITIKRWFAENLEWQQRYSEAESVLREALAAAREKFGSHDAATSVRLISQLAGVLAKLGNDEEAEALAREVIELQRQQEPRPNPFELRKSHDALIQVLLRGGKRDEAIRVERELHEWLLTLARQGDQKRGPLIATAAALLFSQNPELLDVARGREMAERAIALSEAGDLESLRLLARAHALSGDWDRAIEVLESALPSLPGDAARARVLNEVAWNWLTGMPESIRNPVAALRLSLHGNKLSGRSDPAQLDTLSLAYLKTGDAAQAIEIQEKAISLLDADAADRAEYEARLAEYRAALGAESQPSTP